MEKSRLSILFRQRQTVDTHSQELQTILIDDIDDDHLEYIGRRGIGLSGSYQQGYSTAYNTRSHIKVVCNGYILTHILN